MIGSPRHQTRWMSFRNTSKETVPPYGLLALEDGDTGFLGNTKRGEQSVWLLKKPDEAAYADQDPARLFVNGPTPVPAGGYGVCTQDWPAQVLHNGAEDGLPNGYACGPKPDSWFVWSGGRAFTCVTHDRTWPVGVGPYHTVWISSVRADAATTLMATVGRGTTYTVESGKIVPSNEVHDSLLLQFTKGDEAGKWVVSFPGIYLFGFQATIWSDSAARGSVLSLSLAVNDTSTDWKAQRVQDIEVVDYEDDAYNPTELLTTQENVAATGLIKLEEDDVVSVLNTSAYTLRVARFGFWLFRAGAEPRQYAAGGLDYH